MAEQPRRLARLAMGSSLRRWLISVMVAVLAALLAQLAPPSPPPALANHVIPACAFDIDTDPSTFTYMQAYEALDWKNVYARSLELAGGR